MLTQRAGAGGHASREDKAPPRGGPGPCCREPREWTTQALGNVASVTQEGLGPHCGRSLVGCGSGPMRSMTWARALSGLATVFPPLMRPRTPAHLRGVPTAEVEFGRHGANDASDVSHPARALSLSTYSLPARVRPRRAYLTGCSCWDHERSPRVPSTESRRNCRRDLRSAHVRTQAPPANSAAALRSVAPIGAASQCAWLCERRLRARSACTCQLRG